MQRETSNAVVHELERQVAAVRSGDLGRGEDMLVARAHCLDELFSNLARRGFANINAGHVGAGETYLRLAFKAQSQCRSPGRHLQKSRIHALWRSFGGPTSHMGHSR
jgi:hypothetical protein